MSNSNRNFIIAYVLLVGLPVAGLGGEVLLLARRSDCGEHEKQQCVLHPRNCSPGMSLSAMECSGAMF
jgi:hypothetical protein